MLTTLLLFFQGSTPPPVPLQHRVDLAQPGDTISFEVGGTVHLSKPLTLVGLHDPTVTLFLEGQGAGNVIISGATLLAVSGTGFDRLTLFDCLIDAGFEVDAIPYLELTETTFDNFDGGPLLAPDSDVLLTDSSIVPHQLGPVVQAQAVYLSGTPEIGDYDVASLATLTDDLQTSGVTVRIGHSVTLTWQTPGPIASLYASVGSTPPTPIAGAQPGHNLGFLGSPQLQAVAGGTGSYVVDVPASSSLIGTELAFQVYDPPGYYSRPVFVLAH